MGRWLFRFFASWYDSWGTLIATWTLNVAGHAGALLQARRHGSELLVGIHTDEAILKNKGPTVMNLKERLVFMVRLYDPC